MSLNHQNATAKIRIDGLAICCLAQPPPMLGVTNAARRAFGSIAGYAREKLSRLTLSHS